jgi:ribosomal protein L37AE/L43A
MSRQIKVRNGSRYGASSWEIVKRIEIHIQVTRSFRGKTEMKRGTMGIWHCGSCTEAVAGRAWTYNTVGILRGVCYEKSKGTERLGESLSFEAHLTPARNRLIHVEKKNLGWRDGSVGKNTDCSSKGPEFKSHQPHGGSQPSVMRSDGCPLLVGLKTVTVYSYK